ncbi:hypothetical protein D3C85_1841340 [compost metagenome]
MLTFGNAAQAAADVFRKVSAVIETDGDGGKDEFTIVIIDQFLQTFRQHAADTEVPNEDMHQWRDVALVFDEG